MPSRALATALTLVAIAGCGPRDDKYNPSKFEPRGFLIPPNIVAPLGATAGRESGGLYVLSADSGICCFVSKNARITVRKPEPASRLLVNIYIPAVAPFETEAQRIMVTFPASGVSMRFGDLGPGFHKLPVPLPGSLGGRRGNVVVDLTAERSLTHAGSAGPEYAYILMSAYFE